MLVWMPFVRAASEATSSAASGRRHARRPIFWMKARVHASSVTAVGLQPTSAARFAVSASAWCAIDSAAVSSCSTRCGDTVTSDAPIDANPLNAVSGSRSSVAVTPPPKRSAMVLRYCTAVRRRRPAGAGANTPGVADTPAPPLTPAAPVVVPLPAAPLPGSPVAPPRAAQPADVASRRARRCTREGSAQRLSTPAPGRARSWFALAGGHAPAEIGLVYTRVSGAPWAPLPPRMHAPLLLPA